MPTLEVSASSPVNAPAQEVYRILADYEQHHPQILPDAFKELAVEEGGRGEGTVFRIEMQVFGAQRTGRMRVTEPEPGRVLVETGIGSELVTTFTVDPDGDHRSNVTISTVWQAEPGLKGLVDRVFTPRFLRRLYWEELEKLDAYAGELYGAGPA
jgi:hypothetical protein